jgi:uncharacterized membrane protein YgdD (TMEM256/DUF423 family)
MTWTIWIIIGSLAGALAVGFGAFGAHGLRERLDADALAVFDIAARYQMYHALALLAVGFLALRVDNLTIRIAGSAFLLGIVLFSGSLYALALTGQRWMGMITPVGGLSFIVGWVALAIAAYRPT